MSVEVPTPSFPEPKVTVGAQVTLSLEDLVKPWIGATILVQFEGGQKVQARITEVYPDRASIVVTKVDLDKI